MKALRALLSVVGWSAYYVCTGLVATLSMPTNYNMFIMFGWLGTLVWIGVTTWLFSLAKGSRRIFVLSILGVVVYVAFAMIAIAENS